MAFSWNDLPYDVLEGICTATAIHPPDTASSPHDYDSDSGSSSRSTDFNLNDKSWHETLLALSSVDSRTRETCLPLLFTKLRFRKTCVESSPSWESYDELMLLLLGNNALCRTVRVFELSSWISRENKERHLPTTTTYERIPEFIASLPRLHTLVFQLKDHLVPGFTSTFAKLTETRGPLKTVETLSITPSCHFIIGHCPNIRRFEERTWYQDGDVEFTTWMKALGTSCASLRALSTRVEISLTMFQDILDYTPWLETLHLLRERNWWSSGIRSEDDDMQESILQFLPSLSRFQHLRKLVLIDTLTFNKSKRKYMARLKKHGKEALYGRVAAGVEVHCPSVAELWVGYLCFRRDERGLMRSSPGLDDPADALVIYGA